MNNKVSIIMPVYNSEKYLDKSISSVLKQTYSNFELIIIDDGSVDKSVKVCQKYLFDRRIVLFTQKNKGPSSARNKGLRSMSGDFLMFLDADDYLEANALEKLVETINNNMADVCIYAWREFQGKKREHFFSSDECNQGYEKIFSDIIYSPFKCGGGFPWNKIWRVSSIIEKGNLIRFDESLSLYEDKLWTIMNLNRVSKICFLNLIIYNYRISQTSLSHNSNFQLEYLYRAYEASKKIKDYIYKKHTSLLKYADNLEWTFELNYLFAVKIQKKRGTAVEDFEEIYKKFWLKGYRNLGIKFNIKYAILRLRWYLEN